ncbi:MAG: hypothetical protein PHG66_03280 [Candidatus Colwellbacteria bacterium]|nr:hypothetical protein [Candidatus Colwellbacteria bacterium]
MIEVKSINKIRASSELPEIFSYKEDLDLLRSQLSPYIGKKVIVVGNGGSITSFQTYREAFGKENESQIVWSMDPHLIEKTRKNFSPEESVVVAISKSGNTIGAIVALSCFPEYETIAVFEDTKNALRDLSLTKGWMTISHPTIGGRFSGGTSSAFVPAMIIGIDVSAIAEGMTDGYLMKDEAYSLAKGLFDLEEQGYTELYVPIYSSALSGIKDLFIQLMHESVCKDGRGQTVYAAMGPECQHHTNQRFFGGRKNVAALFIAMDSLSSDAFVSIPQDAFEVKAKGVPLRVLHNLPLRKALEAEYLGTRRNAEEEGIPVFDIKISDSSHRTIGELVAFLHLLAFYSADLRGVNPFDQPAVERSKNITIDILGSRREEF